MWQSGRHNVVASTHFLPYDNIPSIEHTTMAFNLIRPAPLRLFGSQASRPVQALLRPFHSASKPALFTGAPVRQSIFASQRPIFRNAFKRTYIEHPYQPVRAEPGLLRQRLLYGAGIFGATLVTANL